MKHFNISKLFFFIKDYLNEWFYGPYCPSVEELKFREKSKNNSGYTFVEMMIVIIIAFILLCIIGSGVKNAAERHNREKEIPYDNSAGSMQLPPNSDTYKPKLN